MKNKFHNNFSKVYFVYGIIMGFVLLLLTDSKIGLIENLPFGSSVVMFVLYMFLIMLYNGMLHLTIKANFEYVKFKEFFEKALTTSQGAGLAIVGTGLFSIAFAIVIHAVLA